MVIPLSNSNSVQVLNGMQSCILVLNRLERGDHFIQWIPIQVHYRNFTASLMVISTTGNGTETIINLATKNGKCKESCSILTPFLNLAKRDPTSESKQNKLESNDYYPVLQTRLGTGNAKEGFPTNRGPKWILYTKSRPRPRSRSTASATEF